MKPLSKILSYIVISSFLLTLNCFSQNRKADSIQLALQKDYVKENVGTEINTMFNETFPVISADGRSLYFSRGGDPRNVGYKNNKENYDIWVSELQKNGRWSFPKNLGYPLNNGGNNYVCSISPDGNSLIIGGEYVSDTTIDQNCSLTYRTISGWSYPEKVHIQNFYNLNKYVSFYLASDWKTLILSIERDDSQGNKDLYVCFKTDENEWSEPLNLGTIINTEFNEATPFLSADMTTLYFSSNGHETYGEMDIFYSKRLDDSWTNWSKPVNIGKPYNTTGTEGGYYLTSRGDKAYFVSSNNTEGGTDIFQVKMKVELKPDPFIVVKGKLINPITKEPLSGYVYYKQADEGRMSGSTRTNPGTGDFAITLPIGKQYRVVAISDSFISAPIMVDAEAYDTITTLSISTPMRNLSDFARKRIVPENLDLISNEILQRIIFNTKTIYFGFNEVPITGEFFPELDYIADILLKYPCFNITIVGHTDRVGTLRYNKELSEHRASEVHNYILSRSVSDSRLVHFGRGYSQPVKDNLTEDNRSMNRRVEFIMNRTIDKNVEIGQKVK